MKMNWLTWHRWLGLITCIGILLWGSSGLSHPIMSRLQPKPEAFVPPAQHLFLHETKGPKTVLTAHGIERLRRLSVVEIGGADYFRVETVKGQAARYFSTSNGDELPDGDERYARFLATHYTGLPASSVVESRLITEFSDDYHAVNRLLPVWRVQFSGEKSLRAFIDTDQGRLATLVDNTRYTLTRVFRIGHNWSFAESSPRLQIAVMACVLAAALISAVSGLFLYFRFRREVSKRLTQKPLRRWHRRLGSLVALSTLVFASSGMFHLFMSFKQEREVFTEQIPEIATEQISDEAWLHLGDKAPGKIDLVSDGSKLYWLLQDAPQRSQVAVLSQEKHAEHEHHESEGPDPGFQLLPADDNLSENEGIASLIHQWAVAHSQKPLSEISQTKIISKFGGEYGFVFKRLPVVKVQFAGAGNPRYYIEPQSGILAAKVEDLDAVEGLSFAYLHKWTFADANKDLRDVLVMLFAFANILVAVLGATMFFRQIFNKKLSKGKRGKLAH